MTDTQVLTLALTLLGIFAASWFNNSRIGDVTSRIGDVRDLLRAEFKADIAVFRAEVNGRFDRIDARLEKMDDNIARILADHETRFNRLEKS